VSGSKEISPFEQMKATLRNNLKGLKKEEDKEGGSESVPTSSTTVNVPVTSGGAASNLPTRRVSAYNIFDCYLDLGFDSSFQLWGRHQKDRLDI
jgi:hypothetical protein